ncbi:hypothetical protein F8388_009086 [Cannabis sativa]|uniref:Longin domain-containing protein n=1 Tax=Cannabis sativa TaxID=3483 RepID=A0A7J6DPE3_CANSA|nr:hypothetical protein G4B88_026073 [Cannabis sativa]KAF4383055.1 hypothetical protein F8388_009086 [Cannabis sativa]
MGQQSLIYTFVARGTVILAEYTEFTGNFTSIASQCLQKLPATNNKFTYNCDGHTFNYLVDEGFTYCVVAVEAIGRQIPIAFLERVKEDFTKRYGGGKAATAVANSLNREFGSKLKEHMQYCVDHPDEINKLAKVKAQVLDRGEKIELLVDKTENLRSQIYGTRFQAAGDPSKEEDVVAEHEDKANCFGNLNRTDSDNRSICLWRLPLLMVLLHSYSILILTMMIGVPLTASSCHHFLENAFLKLSNLNKVKTEQNDIAEKGQKPMQNFHLFH